MPSTLTLVCVSLAGAILYSSLSAPDWRTADRSSAGIAPAPQDEPEALVQVYAARAYKWRGLFAVHSWIATKEANADHYVTYQVMGFNLYRGESPIVIKEEIPDRRWYSAEPELLYTLKGAEAEAAIPQVYAAARSYPYPMNYRAWPGPNSNTFIAHIIRNVPQLRMELPPHAIGKDWLTNGGFVDTSESGTGGQFSAYGLLGATVGKEEGLEVNILGLNFGVDVLRPALKLPLVGRIGMKDAPASPPVSPAASPAASPAEETAKQD